MLLIFRPGDDVIKQGDDGDFFYVVDEGELDCTKQYKDKPEPTFLLTYKPGMSFGELALLYNAPRAAAIAAKTDAVLFGLDRDCFNHIVKEAACKKRNMYEEFLKGLKLFEGIDPYYATKIADGLSLRRSRRTRSWSKR
jgi:cAMP-dependent protein kinase regulator